MSSDKIMTPIAFEGTLTSEEKNTLRNLAGSEVFRIARKICAHRHAQICQALMKIDNPTELVSARGQLLGVDSVYQLLLHCALDQESDVLQKKPKYRNVKMNERSGEQDH